MYELKLFVNSKTKSPSVSEIQKLSKKIGYDINDEDERFYIIKVDKFDKNFAKLVSLSRELKGTKLLLNDSEIKNIDSIMGIYSCKRKKFCDGNCEYITRNWQYIADILLTDDIEEIIKNYEIFLPINERLFDLENYPEIIVSSNDNELKIRKSQFIDSYIEYSQHIKLVCDIFRQDYYIERLKNLPENIVLKKVSYSESREYKEKEEMEQGLENLELIIEKFGDEFEKRLRKVLGEFIKKE